MFTHVTRLNQRVTFHYPHLDIVCHGVSRCAQLSDSRHVHTDPMMPSISTTQARRAAITPPITPDLVQKALEVHKRLCALYQCPIPFFADRDPLSELVSSLLSHRTKNRDSARAYQRLRQRFRSWEDVRDADVEAVQAAICDTTWPEQKAPRLQDVLRRITAERGQLDLGFLASMTITDARAWLETLPGVGEKTSAATLLFSNLRRAALPVDSHHFRVASRIGLIPRGASLAFAHRRLSDLLPSSWDAQHVYDHHEALMLHGQRCCHIEHPACHRCPVQTMCDDYQGRLEEISVPK